MSVQISDRLFVALAKRTGFPSKEDLRRCREIQEDWLEAGTVTTLFVVAQIEGVVESDLAGRFERWARQITSSHPDLKATSEQISPYQAGAQEDAELLEELSEEDVIEEEDAVPFGTGPLAREHERLFGSGSGSGLFGESEVDGLPDALRPSSRLEIVEVSVPVVDLVETVEPDPEGFGSEERSLLDDDDLRLLPDDDDQDLCRMGRAAPPPPRPQRVFGADDIQLIESDEVSQAFEVQATWDQAGGPLEDIVQGRSERACAQDLMASDSDFDPLADALDAIDRPRVQPLNSGGPLSDLVSIYHESSEQPPRLPETPFGLDDDAVSEDDLLDALEDVSEEQHNDTWRDGDPLEEFAAGLRQSRRGKKARARRPRAMVSSGGSGFRTLPRRPSSGSGRVRDRWKR